METVRPRVSRDEGGQYASVVDNRTAYPTCVHFFGLNVVLLSSLWRGLATQLFFTTKNRLRKALQLFSIGFSVLFHVLCLVFFPSYVLSLWSLLLLLCTHMTCIFWIRSPPLGGRKGISYVERDGIRK